MYELVGQKCYNYILLIKQVKLAPIIIMVEFADLFESEEEGFVKKAKVGISSPFARRRLSANGFTA